MSFNLKIQKRISAWLNGPYDEGTKAEIRHLLEQDPKKLEDAFFKDLSFGTGGMRGIMGVGTNRLNIYTIQRATQGLANYIKKQKGGSVFIGYDVRHHSHLFAQIAARTFAGNGIQVLLSKEICPTPLVSFACRHFRCISAVMITASHNPPEYNGYKVYWSDGGQVVPPHDQGILDEVHQVKEIELSDIGSPLIRWIGDEIDAIYLAGIGKLQIEPNLSRIPLKIIYSNLHGTGIRLVPKALKSWGYKEVAFVEKQKSLDGDFPYAHRPNPEEKAALQLGIEQLLKTKADIFIATDPDADRVGLVIRENDRAHRFSGHQIACLCLYHICSSFQTKGMSPKRAAFIKTIVTTELFKTISESFGGMCIDVLTGFKYIAERIHQWETSPVHFVFGAEESYGYLFGTLVRDKDAISTSCLIAEAAAAAKKEGLTLLTRLYQIYEQYGVHRESLADIVFDDSQEGLDEMKQLMQRLRHAPPTLIGGQKVIRLEDYLKPTDLPRSDVLRFWLSDKSKLVIRPSGTEPKIKIYAEVVEKTKEDVQSAIAHAEKRLDNLVANFRTYVHGSKDASTQAF